MSEVELETELLMDALRELLSEVESVQAAWTVGGASTATTRHALDRIEPRCTELLSAELSKIEADKFSSWQSEADRFVGPDVLDVRIDHYKGFLENLLIELRRFKLPATRRRARRDDQNEVFAKKLNDFDREVRTVHATWMRDHNEVVANATLDRISSRCEEWLREAISNDEAGTFRHWWNDSVVYTDQRFALVTRLHHYEAYLSALAGEVEKVGVEVLRERGRKKDAARKHPRPIDTVALVKSVCERFHESLIQIQQPHRHGQRPSYEIADEHDVQDLLHAILAAYVDTEVRDEEPTPSVVAGWSLIDFVLSEDGIALEVKYIGPDSSTRSSAIADGLIIDVARYPARQDVRDVVCFVYDPVRRIKSAKAFVNDLEKLSTDKVRVHAVLSPKRF